MKTRINKLFLIAVILLITSCSTAKLTISGIPGTKIMRVDGETISTIDATGTTTVKIAKDYGYILLSQTPKDNTVVPFIPNCKDTPSLLPYGMLAMICLPGIGLTSFAICDQTWILPQTQTNNDIVNGAAIKTYRESKR